MFTCGPSDDGRNRVGSCTQSLSSSPGFRFCASALAGKLSPTCRAAEASLASGEGSSVRVRSASRRAGLASRTAMQTASPSWSSETPRHSPAPAAGNFYIFRLRLTSRALTSRALPATKPQPLATTYSASTLGDAFYSSRSVNSRRTLRSNSILRGTAVPNSGCALWSKSWPISATS